MTLLELLQLIKRSMKLMIILPVACLALAAIYAWGFMDDEYTSETSIYALTAFNSSVAENAVSSSDMTASQQLANDFAELAQNEQIQLRAAESLGMESLKGYAISVSNSSTNRIIKVAVTGAESESCALIANALAKEIGDTAVDVMGVDAVNVITKAQVSELPSGPNRLMYALVALLAGIFLAIAIIVLKDMLNTTMRTDEDVREIMDLPVIGHIPTVKGGR